MSLAALVLAGTRRKETGSGDWLGGVSHKALLPLHGKTMIAHVLSAIEATSDVGPLFVSIEKADLLSDLKHETCFLPTENGPSASIARAVHQTGTPLLVTTADHPLLESRWIDFIRAQADATACDLAIGVATRQTVERDVPNTKRTFVRLKDIEFSGCNLFLLRTQKALAVVELWQRLEQNRKRPFHLAKALGYAILWRAVTGRLTSGVLRDRVRKLTGANVRFVCLDDGRAAVDVDNARDFQLVQSLMHSRK